MKKKDRVNCFDFIEFPKKSIEDLNQSKAFYIYVSGIVCVGRAMAIGSKELMSVTWILQEYLL